MGCFLSNNSSQTFHIVCQVLFNATGTLVTSNTIVARTRVGLGAINMVDPGVCQCLTPDHTWGFSSFSVKQMTGTTLSPESRITPL